MNAGRSCRPRRLPPHHSAAGQQQLARNVTRDVALLLAELSR
jgi:hypothetical protein